MKIALVSLYFDPNAMAIRLLSSILKRDFPGDEINVVLLSHKFKPPRMDFDLETEEDLAAIRHFFAEQQFDIIGISLMTNYLERAIQLTQAIRQVSPAKILWGGIHPTLRPEECARHADIVFVGEAESSLPEAVRRIRNGEPLSEMAGIRFRENGDMAGQGTGPACLDLDSLPFPDYDFATQFIFSPEERCVVPMRAEYFRKSDWMYTDGKPFHRIMTARGCSQACSYCINAEYKKLLGIHGLAARKRSLQSVMAELEMVVKLGIFQKIMFIDDDILLRSTGWLKEFSGIYPERIALPFVCQVTAGRVTAEKIGYLKKAGVSGINMGVQSGSDRLNFEIFNRKISREHVLKASRIIHDEGGMNLGYDFLVRNPYESLHDRIETVTLLLELSPPFAVRTYALTFFPGMPLTDRAREDGFLDSDSAASIYDYECSPEEQAWQEALIKLPTVAKEKRQQLLTRLGTIPPRSDRELMALIRGDKADAPLDSLWRQVRAMFPDVSLADYYDALFAAWKVHTGIKGRHCGDIGDKAAQYLSVAQYARGTESYRFDSLEIGTLFGGSCLMKLFAMRNLGIDGRVVCIDPMSGYYGEEVDAESNLPVTEGIFYENVLNFGFAREQVELRTVRSDQPEACADLPPRFATIMIDGDHSYEGIAQDCSAFIPLLAENGVLVFDDYAELNWPDITRFIDAFRSDLPSGLREMGGVGTTICFGRRAADKDGVAPATTEKASIADLIAHFADLPADAAQPFCDFLSKGLDELEEQCNLANLGAIYARLGEHHSAREYFARSLRLDGDKRRRFKSLTGFADYCMSQGELPEAEKHYKDALALGNDSDASTGRALVKLGIIYNEQKRVAEARDAFSRALAISDLSTANRFFCLLHLAQYAYSEQRFDDAESMYKGCLEIQGSETNKYSDCSTGRILVRLGTIYYGRKSIAEARDAFKRALEASDLSPANRFFSLLQLANCSYTERQFADAAGLYRECLEIEGGEASKYVEAALRLGNSLRKLDREAEAEVYYRAVLDKQGLSPTSRFTLNQRLGEELTRQRRFPDAKECFANAWAVDGIPEEVRMSIMPQLETCNIHLLTPAQASAPLIDKKRPHLSIRHLDSAGALAALKDLYAGERAFILGNGPSLNLVDLTLLKDEITFGTNSIFYNFEKMGFKPTFYVVEDKLVAEDRATEITGLTGMTKIFGEYLGYCIGDSAETIWANVIFDFSNYPGFPHFSKDAAECLWVGGTVSYLCMQLAYHMGFKEVYLVGFDHNYVVPGDAVVKGTEITSASADPNHFHPDYFGKGKRWHDPRTDRMELAYGRAREAFAADGRKIFNATAGGKLEVFPRVEYASLFCQKGGIEDQPAQSGQAGQAVSPRTGSCADNGKVEEIIPKREIQAIIDLHLPLNSPRVMVQIGSSTLKLASEFADSGWDVFAFDANPFWNRSDLPKSLRFFNKAIATEETDSVTFYLSDTIPSIGSLKSFHPTHKPVTVPATTLTSFYRDFSVGAIDYFQIDAELMDLDIMKTHDWSIPISVLLMECTPGNVMSIHEFIKSKVPAYEHLVFEWHKPSNELGVMGKCVGIRSAAEFAERASGSGYFGDILFFNPAIKHRKKTPAVSPSYGSNACKVCGDRVSGHGTAYGKKWFKCPGCDFLQADLSADLVHKLKRGEGFRAGTGVGGGGYREFYLSQLCTHNLNGRRILLYGTGNTSTLETLLDAGLDAYGCDYSYDLIADRQKKFGASRFFHPDAMPDIQFDAIVAVEVFEHFDSPRDQLGKLMGHLSKRGVVTGTTDFWDGSDISDHIYIKSDLHVAYWSDRSMSAAARGFGYNCRLFELVCPGSVKPDEKFGLLWPRKRVFFVYPDLHEQYFETLHKYVPVLPIDKP